MNVRRWLPTACLLTSLVAVPSAAQADSGPGGEEKAGHFRFAVIGDVPYGEEQVAALPSWIQQINAADPRLTFHVGDIKNGSTRCDDAYYRMIRGSFDAFDSPLLYTPGDNEWTDCHRENNGAYNPLERLTFDRSVFFAQPGTSMGQDPIKVRSQARAGFPENIQLRRQHVSFAMLHVVGSNNGLQPWEGLGLTSPTTAQVAEEKARMANVIRVVRATFESARERGDRAVVLLQQADMFDPTYTPTWNDISAFQPLVQVLIRESRRFAGEVYLFNGDSHAYNTDRPLAAGSTWLDTYGVHGSADNLTRITVDGSDNNTDWLEVTINRRGAADVLDWEQVPFTP